MTEVEQETYTRAIRGRDYTFTSGELVTCYKSGYFVIQSFLTQPGRNNTDPNLVYVRVKKIYKTKEPMRRPSSYIIRANTMLPVSASDVESNYAIESERARTKYNTLSPHARN